MKMPKCATKCTTKCVLSLVAAPMMALILAACGGGGGGSGGNGGGTVLAADAPQVVPPRFAAQVTFGDTLSDVGSYAVGSVAFLGGGKFTINGDASAYYPELIGKTWTELLAPVFGLPAPCAAQTGLQGDPARGLSVPVVNHPGCYGYAQGGARLFDPVGPGNAASSWPLGELTVPVATQVANHLAVAGGRFQGNEIVFVMAGESDLLTLWSQLSAGAFSAGQAAGPYGEPQARANYLLTNGPMAIATMAAAGNDLATLVREQIVANGANYVVVNNLRDLAGTPLGNAEDPALRSLVRTMIETFNRSLKAGLDAEPRVAQVDMYFLSRDELFNPAFYALSNTFAPACGQNAVGGNALFCNVYNTLPGVDVSHFMYADNINLTPYAQWLMARHVAAGMMAKGWL
jgi:phospholipase/lecithinase/hemolysin